MEAPPGPGPMELDAPPPAAAAAAIPPAGSDKVSGWPRSGSGGGGRGLAPPDLLLPAGCACGVMHVVLMAPFHLSVFAAAQGRGRGRRCDGPYHLHHHRREERRAQAGKLHFLSLSVLPACLCLSCRCVRQCCCARLLRLRFKWLVPIVL